MKNNNGDTEMIVTWLENNSGWHSATDIHKALSLANKHVLLKQLFESGKIERKRETSIANWRYRFPVQASTAVFNLIIGYPPKRLPKGKLVLLADTQHPQQAQLPNSAYNTHCMGI